MTDRIATLTLIAALTTPSPSPASCTDLNAGVRLIAAAPIVYPESAVHLELGEVFVDVEVTVGTTGRIERARVLKSSYNMAIDQAVMRAARQSSYSPAVDNCQPVSGTYVFHGDAIPPP